MLLRLVEAEGQKQPRTSFDYTVMFNRKRAQLGLSPVETNVVNNFFTHAPEGQSCVTRGLVALSVSGGPRPKWATGQVSTAPSVEKRPGELVKFDKRTGLAEIDGILDQGVGRLQTMAAKLPMRRQADILSVGDDINSAGFAVKTFSQLYENEKAERKRERSSNERTISAQDKTISTLEGRVSELEAQLAALRAEAAE